MRTIKFRAWIKGKMLSTDDLLARGFCPMSIVSVDGDKAIFMQFTGLHDKNGREVYEGDVINVKHDGWGTSEYENCVVEWDEIGFFPWTDVSAQIDIDYLASREPDKIEVIGNIYENPELLNDE